MDLEFVRLTQLIELYSLFLMQYPICYQPQSSQERNNNLPKCCDIDRFHPAQRMGTTFVTEKVDKTLYNHPSQAI
jgi:hypothetical protein